MSVPRVSQAARQSSTTQAPTTHPPSPTLPSHLLRVVRPWDAEPVRLLRMPAAGGGVGGDADEDAGIACQAAFTYPSITKLTARARSCCMTSRGFAIVDRCCCWLGARSRLCGEFGVGMGRGESVPSEAGWTDWIVRLRDMCAGWPLGPHTNATRSVPIRSPWAATLGLGCRRPHRRNTARLGGGPGLANSGCDGPLCRLRLAGQRLVHTKPIGKCSPRTAAG